MKITHAEVALLEKVRERKADPALIAANLDALAEGCFDILRYLCMTCVRRTEKVLLFRAL